MGNAALANPREPHCRHHALPATSPHRNLEGGYLLRESRCRRKGVAPEDVVLLGQQVRHRLTCRHVWQKPERVLQDVITKLEPDLFVAVTGLTVKDFHLLVLLKLFNTEQMNQAVFAFRRYEDASLRYTGIESHDGLSHYGLYDNCGLESLNDPGRWERLTSGVPMPLRSTLGIRIMRFSFARRFGSDTNQRPSMTQSRHSPLRAESR
jgi:hypothetical protein